MSSLSSAALLTVLSLLVVPLELLLLRRLGKGLRNVEVELLALFGSLGAVAVAVIAVIPAMAIVGEPWSIIISAAILEVAYIWWFTRFLRDCQAR